MQMHEVIAQLREKKGLRIIDLHNVMKKLFGEKALCYRTLLRILYGQTNARDATLHQICIALDTTPAYVRSLVNKDLGMNTIYTKRSLRKKRFIYNQKAFADILSGPERKFSIIELTLLPKGMTKVERRSQKKEVSEAWVYGVRNITHCRVSEREFRVKKGDCIAFDCNLEHAFENKTPRKSQCLIIQSNS